MKANTFTDAILKKMFERLTKSDFRMLCKQRTETHLSSNDGNEKYGCKDAVRRFIAS